MAAGSCAAELGRGARDAGSAARDDDSCYAEKLSPQAQL
jgi:hypothetical protein